MLCIFYSYGCRETVTNYCKPSVLLLLLVEIYFFVFLFLVILSCISLCWSGLRFNNLSYDPLPRSASNDWVELGSSRVYWQIRETMHTWLHATVEWCLVHQEAFRYGLLNSGSCSSQSCLLKELLHFSRQFCSHLNYSSW